MNYPETDKGNSFRMYVIAIKAAAILLILGGFKAIGLKIYVLMISSQEYPQSIPDVNALYVLRYVLSMSLITWSITLGIYSFGIFKWSRICILWWCYLGFFKAIYENSSFLYYLLRGLGGAEIVFRSNPVFSILSLVLSISVPLFFVLFYSHEKVKAAFESKDQCIRWNDKHPYLLWLINIVIVLIIVFQEWSKW